ncbi:MAG: hypothetical protein ACPGEF_07790 [Endozoicomonas sp.]
MQGTEGKCQERLFSLGTHGVYLGFQGAGYPAITETLLMIVSAIMSNVS